MPHRGAVLAGFPFLHLVQTYGQFFRELGLRIGAAEGSDILC